MPSVVMQHQRSSFYHFRRRVFWELTKAFDYVIRILMPTQLDFYKQTTFCRFVGKTLETRAALPGLKVEYSADEGVTWSDVTSNMEVEGKIKLRTRSVCNGYL